MKINSMSKEYVKVYLFFLNDINIYHEILYRYGYELENEYIKDSKLLYAWTSKKKLMKKYAKLRKDIFDIMSINIDVSKYNDFAETYELQEIIDGKFDDNNERLYPTLYEYTLIEDYFRDTLLITLSEYTKIYPMLFKDIYRESLDILLYNNSYFLSEYSYDHKMEYEELYSYNLDFNISGEYGYDIKDILGMLDKVTLYKYIFTDILLN